MYCTLFISSTGAEFSREVLQKSYEIQGYVILWLQSIEKIVESSKNNVALQS